MFKIGDRVAYTESYFKRAFGVLQGCTSKEWSQGTVTDVQDVDGIQVIRISWRMAYKPSDWQRANNFERV
jgi:hypothetical protein